MNSPVEIRSAGSLGYLIDERYHLHDPGTRHPESPQRLTALLQTLQEFGATDRWHRVQPREATPAELELVHEPALIERVKQAAARAPSFLDFDTPVSAQSYDIALLAAGGVLECVDSLCTEMLRRIFAFVRPPGHHAGHDSARGFCLFNNIAIAAAYARKKYKLERIAVVDFDVHHGNGTQSCFYDVPEVLYISTHQFPFYPGTGDFDEVGKGAGKGYTLNLPFAEGMGDSNFIPVYSRIVSTVLDQYQPQLILVSAGFDGYYRDPLGGLSFTQLGYGSVSASLILAAERWSRGKICFVLEGGYSMQGLQEGARAILEQMEKEHPVELTVRDGANFMEISKTAAKFSRWKW